jgi:hypothetical protein
MISLTCDFCGKVVFNGHFSSKYDEVLKEAFMYGWTVRDEDHCCNVCTARLDAAEGLGDSQVESTEIIAQELTKE